MSIYNKSVRLLFRDMVKEMELQKDEMITKEQILSWFHEKYPKIKDTTISAHLVLLSVNKSSRIHYNVHPDGQDDLFFQLDNGKFRLYDSVNDPTPIYKESDIERRDISVEEDETLTEGHNEFAYERDLQNFLAKNLQLLEPGLLLYEDEGIQGIEFPVGNRYIDILAMDKDNNYVVIELKVSRGYDRTVGQLLRYIAWIRKNLAEEGQGVRGIIVAREISEDLRLACSEVAGIDLFEYQLSVSLKRI